MQEEAILFERLPVIRKSLRIAVVTETYPPEVNGVATSLGQFVAGLHRRGHEIQLVRPKQNLEDRAGGNGGAGAGFHEVLMRGMPIPRYPALKMGLPAKQSLVRLWSFARPDLVHIVTEGPLGWSALQAALKLKLPVSSDFRTNFHAYTRHYGVGWLKRPIVAYLRKFHNLAGCTMVPTEALMHELADLGFRNLRVIARGVDTRLFDPARRSEELRRRWAAGEEDPVVLHVGRLAPEKNLDDLLSAFAVIRARAPGARLVFVGDGPQRAELAARCPDAIFAGMRAGEDLATHYASGDIFLFPSLTETYGNVTIEAMASGLAIVAYNYAAAAAHIRDDENGRVAGYGDREAFTAAAGALAADPAHRRALGSRARASAESLDWNRVVGEFEAALIAVSDAALRAHDAAA